MEPSKQIPTEYLFVDQQRLDSYFEQISDPIKYDKVPIWKVALKLSGPSAEGEQARPGRAYSTHEKLRALEDYLDSAGLLSTDIGRASPEPSPFALRTLTASQLLIPSQSLGTAHFAGARVWMGNVTPKILLILIENAKVDDDDRWQPRLSMYTSLLLLSQELQAKGDSPLVIGGLEPYDQPGRKAQDDFDVNPVAFVESLGAKMLTSRSIRVLYRIRVDFSERGTIIAYPIYVAAA